MGSCFYSRNEEKEIENTLLIENLDEKRKSEKVDNNEFLFTLKLTYTGPKEVEEVGQFPSGNILIITKTKILILNKIFKLLTGKDREEIGKYEKLDIKDDSLFATYEIYEEATILIWKVENPHENRKISIKFYGKIQNHRYINGIAILNENLIIILESQGFFTYKKSAENDNKLPYSYNKSEPIFKKYNRSFLLTDDKKYLILYESGIEIYDIDNFKLISFCNAYEACYEERKLMLIDENYLALQLKRKERSVDDIPYDKLLIFDIKDIKNIKILYNIQLDEEGIGIFNKRKYFVFAPYYSKGNDIYIYSFDNLINRQITLYDEYIEEGNNLYEEKKYGPKIMKINRYYMDNYTLKCCILNKNEFCFYGKKDKISIYEINKNNKKIIFPKE